MTNRELQELPILSLISTATIEATTENLVAKSIFTLSSGFMVWGAFHKRFTEGDGKIEEPMGERTLCYYKLRRPSVDHPIIDALGGETKAETYLADIVALIRAHDNGEDSVLQTNGSANIFYVRGQDGKLLTVSLTRRGHSRWGITASSVEHPLSWPAGSRVFSRQAA